MVTVERLYGELWSDDAALNAELDRSLGPRSPDVLYERFAELGVAADDLVLDVGARNATYAVELARRFGCRVVAVDPVPIHAEWSARTIAESGLGARVRFEQAGIEALPLADGETSHVWCRDVLNHVDLARGLAECRRVLRPGGGMLVYQTFATDLMEPKEAERIYRSMAIVPANMDDRFFERTAAESGFEILLKDPLDCEWRERRIEEGNREALDDLLGIARLRHRQDELVGRFGEDACEAAWGGKVWGIYQFLGKLRPTVYLLRVLSSES
jgi:sarcosine/dimethylglycine N-methyltransferase